MKKYLWIALISIALYGVFVAYGMWTVQRFFPPNSFGDKWSQHYFTAKWYSSQLLAMDEAPLPEVAKDENAVVYRFTCLRTFHRPFSIKIPRVNEGFTLERKVLSGQGGYVPGEIEDSSKSDIKAVKIAELEELLEDSKFSDMPSSVAGLGFDGSQWILEVVREGKYKVVDRWTPKEDSSIRKLGIWFLDTAKWTPRELY